VPADFEPAAAPPAWPPTPPELLAVDDRRAAMLAHLAPLAAEGNEWAALYVYRLTNGETPERVLADLERLIGHVATTMAVCRQMATSLLASVADMTTSPAWAALVELGRSMGADTRRQHAHYARHAGAARARARRGRRRGR
jgi:hypothetical protein